MLNTNFANSTHAALVEESLKNAYNTLSDFANSEEFLLKIQTAFGETFHADKLEGLRQQWIAGDFASLPQIEILTGTQLRGANAAYAGENNTIYFSEDFLSQYADNLSAINSVLLEEIGHYVDWQINDEDTPGDEGELFSNLVQGFELSESQVQALQSEDDSVVLNMKFSPKYDDFSNSPFLALSDQFMQGEKSDSEDFTYSNGYSWNWRTVLQSIIQSRGTSKVFFINGMNVTDININAHSNAVKDAFGITNSSTAPLDSLEYKNYENISESKGKEAEPNFKTFHDIIIPHLFEYAVDDFEDLYGKDFREEHKKWKDWVRDVKT